MKKNLFLKKSILISVCIGISLILVIVSSALANSFQISAFIGGTGVTLYEESYVYDNRDGVNAGCTWVSRSSPEVASTKSIDPASCWSICNYSTPFEIQRKNTSKTGYAGNVSLSTYVTYLGSGLNSCSGVISPNRTIKAQAKHSIQDDGGFWENWTSASMNIYCPSCSR